MLGLCLATTCVFLSVRQCVVAKYTRWTLLSVFIVVFYTVLSVFLLPNAIRFFQVEPFVFCLFLFGMWISFDLYRLKTKTFSFSAFRLVLGSFFALFTLLFFSCVQLPHLYSREEILQIELTAEPKEEIITWKHPSSTLQSQKITSHRVIVRDMKENVLFDGFVYGDLASIRLKMMSFPLFMQWIGFPHLWQAEAISSDYIHIKKKKHAPIETNSMTTKKSWLSTVLWGFWEKSFYYESHPFFLKSASLTSTHFPLLDRRGEPLKGRFIILLSHESSAPFTAKVEELKISRK